MAPERRIENITIFRPEEENVVPPLHTEGAEKVHERLEMDFICNWLVSFEIAGVENNTSVATMVHARAYLLEFI
jgi:hypothetical protein